MDDLAQRLDATAAETGFAGVVRFDPPGGAAPLERAYGLADRAHGVPMTPGTQLAMASGTKGFTALVVMALVEQGRLELSTTARSLLGADLPLIADDVTVEQLLSHRSGIGDYLDEGQEGGVGDYPMPVSVHLLDTTEAFVPILDGYPTAFPAGERFAYCNGGFVVLALLAERASGRDYHALVRELVWTPAGMTDTDFLRSDDLPGRAAVGYSQIDGPWRTNVFQLPVLGNGDGGSYTTAADMHRFWRALLAGRIVGPETLAEMVRARSTMEQRGYGLGFWLREADDRVQLHGEDAGVSFLSEHDPVTGATVTVLANTSDGAWPMAAVLTAEVAGLTAP